jgi:SOS-response transcriptional repressor LexA
MTTRYGLTRRQRDTLNFIKDFIAKNDYAPTFDEIGEAVGIPSKSTIAWLLDQLAERGHIIQLAGQSRSIAIVEKGSALEALSRKARTDLLAYCRRTDQKPDDVINDAVLLYVDEEEAKLVPEVRAGQ